MKPFFRDCNMYLSCMVLAFDSKTKILSNVDHTSTEFVHWITCPNMDLVMDESSQFMRIDQVWSDSHILDFEQSEFHYQLCILEIVLDIFSYLWGNLPICEPLLQVVFDISNIHSFSCQVILRLDLELRRKEGLLQVKSLRMSLWVQTFLHNSNTMLRCREAICGVLN